MTDIVEIVFKTYKTGTYLHVGEMKISSVPSFNKLLKSLSSEALAC